MRNLVTACITAGLVLILCIGGVEGDFGDRVTNSSDEVGLPVEDFATNGIPLPSPFAFKQTPVQIGYWDISSNPLFDEDDVLYLHIGGAISPGPTTIRVNDIRLKNSPFGPAGSKVKANDSDMGQVLTAFPAGLPQIVFVDEGLAIGQFDIDEPVYIKTVFPLGEISTGDIRLSLSPFSTYQPGTMVLDFHSDNGASCRILHPGPSFDIWVPWAARGKIRFYNANGNLYIAPGVPSAVWPSPPVYDKDDDVYFDVSSPSGFPARTFGYITPNAIHLSN